MMESILIKIAINTICSGVLAKRLAVAAGIIKSDVIISAPTNFILNAIVSAVKIIKINRIFLMLMPSTWASSGETVVESQACQK